MRNSQQQAQLTIGPEPGRTKSSVNPSRQPKVEFHRTIALGFLAVAALVFGLGGWMAFTEISGAIVATGSVAVKGDTKTIQHLDGGIVTEINVANGDRVRAGDPLVRLDDTLMRANLEIYRNRLAEALGRRHRLIAERDGGRRIIWPSEQNAPLGVMPDEQVRKSQENLLGVRRASQQGQLAQINQKISQYANQIEGVRGLKAAKAEQIRLIKRELAGLTALFAKGNTTLTRLLTLEREKSRLLGQQAEHDAEVARITNLISETRIQRLQVDREFGEKVLSELRAAEREVNDLVQQYYATREKLARVIVRAPVDGIVHQLTVFTIGGVIAAGAPVMQIVPTSETIEVVAKVDPQFIDEVHLDQASMVEISALNRRETPLLQGVVRHVSPTSVVNETSGLSYYDVRIEVAAEEMAKIGGRDRLIPGMPVAAFIKTGDRSVLDYILRPLIDQVRRAFREE